MAVAASPHKIADFQSRLLRDHVREQGVGCDVEGYAEEDIGAALIELAGQFAIGHIKLENAWQGGNFMRGMSDTFHAETISRRESGLLRICSISWLIWSICPPSGVGHERH